MIPPDQEIYDVERRIAERRHRVEAVARQTGQAAFRTLTSPWTLAGAAVLGAAAILGSVLARDLQELALAQFMAGGFWGAASVAAYTAAIGFGRTGREGGMLGTLFAVLALAAFARIAAYASDLIVQPELKALLPWIPQAAWLLSAALLFLAARAFRRD